MFLVVFLLDFLFLCLPTKDEIPAAFPTPLESFYIDEEKKFKDFIEKIIENIGESRPFHLTESARKFDREIS